MKRGIWLLAGIMLFQAGEVGAERFMVRPEKDDNLVVFLSKAPMESFEGKTRAVGGFVEFDPAALADSVTFEFEVDLVGLDTGLAMRNKHMRENHLHTDRFPKAVFRGGRVSNSSRSTLAPGESASFTLSGTFMLHGVDRRLEVAVEATRRSDGALGIVARFPVALADYNIERPKFLVLKLDEVQRVTVTLTAVPEP